MKTTNRVELLNIAKAFGGVKALKDVSLQVLPGEVHALLGENGAGKSTLMKVLSGAHQKDNGTIFIDGKEVWFYCCSTRNILCLQNQLERG